MLFFSWYVVVCNDKLWISVRPWHFHKGKFQILARKKHSGCHKSLEICRGDHLLQHQHTSSHCSGLMTHMKPPIVFIFTRLGEESNLKAVESLMIHWPVYNRDPVETYAFTWGLCLPSSMFSWPDTDNLRSPRFLKQVGMDRQETIPVEAPQGHWWRTQQMTCGRCWAQWGKHSRAFSFSPRCNCSGF